MSRFSISKWLVHSRPAVIAAADAARMLHDPLRNERGPQAVAVVLDPIAK